MVLWLLQAQISPNIAKYNNAISFPVMELINGERKNGQEIKTAPLPINRKKVK